MIGKENKQIKKKIINMEIISLVLLNVCIIYLISLMIRGIFIIEDNPDAISVVLMVMFFIFTGIIILFIGSIILTKIRTSKRIHKISEELCQKEKEEK